jgi:DnaJ-class molecular chaperone
VKSCAGCLVAFAAFFCSCLGLPTLRAKAQGLGLPCEDCHGDAHQIEGGGDPKSPVNHANIPATCGRCHGQSFLMESNGESAQAFISYQSSVHGRAVANGSKDAAVCTDCHGTHEILPANDPKSPISKFSVAQTCGACHADVANTFT